MDHAARMGVGHRLADLEEHAQQERLIGGCVGPGVQEIGQGAALDQLHREIRATIGEGAELVDRHDAGMLQLAGDPGLLDEASDEAGVVAVLVEEDLDGDVAADVAVAALEDGAHAAAADLAEELEAGDGFGGRGHLAGAGPGDGPAVGVRFGDAELVAGDGLEGLG